MDQVAVRGTGFKYPPRTNRTGQYRIPPVSCSHLIVIVALSHHDTFLSLRGAASCPELGLIEVQDLLRTSSARSIPGCVLVKALALLHKQAIHVV